jgi:hypothetical protein
MVIELHLAGVAGDPRAVEHDGGRFRDQSSWSNLFWAEEDEVGSFEKSRQ